MSDARRRIPLCQPRRSHSATLLAGGRVLLVGGGGRATDEPTGACNFADPRSHDSAEIVDPTTGTSTAIAPLITPREGHVALPLGDGSVVVAGGMIDYG